MRNPRGIFGVFNQQVTRTMRRPFVALLLFASTSLLAQQAPPQAAAGKPATGRLICTPVPGGKIVKRVTPLYPKTISAKALAGGVIVKLTIDKQGVPQDLQVIKGDPILAKAALEALKQWRWKPYKLNGEPVEVESSVYIRFEPARE